MSKIYGYNLAPNIYYKAAPSRQAKEISLNFKRRHSSVDLDTIQADDNYKNPNDIHDASSIKRQRKEVFQALLCITSQKNVENQDAKGTKIYGQAQKIRTVLASLRSLEEDKLKVVRIHLNHASNQEPSSNFMKMET